MRPSTLTPTAKQEIERIAMERAKLLTDVELSLKCGVSRRRIQQIMKETRDFLLGNNQSIEGIEK